VDEAAPQHASGHGGFNPMPHRLTDRAGRALLLAALFLSPALPARAGAPRLSGRITGPGGAPLAAVRVRIFADGIPVASAWADSLGDYAVDIPPLPEGRTAVAWFIPADDGIVAECALLAESPAARRAEVYFPCIPRIALSAEGAEFSPVLLDEAGRMERLRGLPCFERYIKRTP
jgi:hypothetical protein